MIWAGRRSGLFKRTVELGTFTCLYGCHFHIGGYYDDNSAPIVQ